MAGKKFDSAFDYYCDYCHNVVRGREEKVVVSSGNKLLFIYHRNCYQILKAELAEMYRQGLQELDRGRKEEI